MPVSFCSIWRRSANRKGSVAALRDLLPSKPKSKNALKKVSDDRWLAEMTRCIFQAGFNWKTVDKMWPAFEEAFEGFDPHRCRMMSDDDIDRLSRDTTIVRYPAKIRSVQKNAAFVLALRKEHGSAAAFFTAWPSSDFVGLLETLKKRGDRLGGQTAQYFLRGMGVDGFILSKDGVAALIDAGVIDGPPTSRAAMRAVQTAFNSWVDESGMSLTEISRVLSLSTGENTAEALPEPAARRNA